MMKALDVMSSPAISVGPDTGVRRITADRSIEAYIKSHARQARGAARIAAENVSGVRRVEDRRFLFRDLPSMA